MSIQTKIRILSLSVIAAGGLSYPPAAASAEVPLACTQQQRMTASKMLWGLCDGAPSADAMIYFSCSGSTIAVSDWRC